MALGTSILAVSFIIAGTADPAPSRIGAAAAASLTTNKN